MNPNSGTGFTNKTKRTISTTTVRLVLNPPHDNTVLVMLTELVALSTELVVQISHE